MKFNLKMFLRCFSLALALSLAVSGVLLSAGQNTTYAQTTTPPANPDSEDGSGMIDTSLEKTELFFVKDGKVTAVGRDTTGGAQHIEFTLIDLLDGPTEEESKEGYYTEIPDGVRLMHTTISNDRKSFSVELSDELLEIESKDKAKIAIEQIEKTIQKVSKADSVKITVGGEDIYAAMGLENGKDKDHSDDKDSHDDDHYHEVSESSNVLALIIIILIFLIAIAAIIKSISFLGLKKEKDEEESDKQSSKKKGK